MRKTDLTPSAGLRQGKTTVAMDAVAIIKFIWNGWCRERSNGSH